MTVYFENVVSEEDTDTDVYMVRRLDAESSPDNLRTTLEEALDTLQLRVQQIPHVARRSCKPFRTFTRSAC